MCLNLGRITIAKNLILKIILQENHKKSITVLQKETQIYKLKLDCKEKDEENLKLKFDSEKLQENMHKIKEEYYENLKLEKENCKTMLNSSTKRLKELRMQYESEQQLLITSLTNLGYEAYLMSQQKATKSASK